MADENEDQTALDPAEVLQAFPVGPAQIERTALVKRDQLTLMGPIQQGTEALVTFLYTAPNGDVYLERARFYVEKKDTKGHGTLRPTGEDPRLPAGFRLDIPSPSYATDPTRAWPYLFELMPDRTLESHKITYFQAADATDHRVDIFSLHALHAAMRGTPNRTVEVVAEYERVLGLTVKVGAGAPPEVDFTNRSAAEAAYIGRMMSQLLNMVRYDRNRIMEEHPILIEMFNDTIDQAVRLHAVTYHRPYTVYAKEAAKNVSRRTAFENMMRHRNAPAVTTPAPTSTAMVDGGARVQPVRVNRRRPAVNSATPNAAPPAAPSS